MPRISIITPTYNSGSTVDKTIEALLNQNFTDFEYIVIDGLSKDNTVEKIKSYIPIFEEKGISVTVISEKDRGVYDAMNKGIDFAQGELIGITNSDDWYENDTLEIMWNTFDENSINKSNTILYGIERVWKDGKVFNLQRRGVDFINDGTLPHSTFFVSRDVYKKYGAFDLNVRILADYDFYCRCWKNGVDLIGIDKVISNFCLGGISSSFFEYYSDYYLLQEKYGFISTKRYKELIGVLKIKKFLSKFVKRW